MLFLGFSRIITTSVLVLSMVVCEPISAGAENVALCATFQQQRSFTIWGLASIWETPWKLAVTG